MSAAREEILGRIRTALAPAPGAPAPTAEAMSPAVEDAPAVDGGPEADGSSAESPLDGPALVDLFVERVEDYRATVTVIDAEALPATLAAVCARHAVATLAVPDGVPEHWVPAGVEVLTPGEVDGAAVRALDGVDGVLTGCALAVAETGTIVLDGGPGQGPRAITLLPDLHVCVVRAGQVVPGVPELTTAMSEAICAHGRPLTLISGPSATSDIELDRVEGVHGPRRLEVVVVRDEEPAVS